MSRPTLQQLSYLLALADEGHFGRAAHTCNVSQPGLSSQIKELEERLGVPLVERLPRGIRLTPEGADAVARARSILRDVDELVDAARTSSQSLLGPLVVGAIPTVAPYVLGDFVPAVVQSHAEATLRFEELTTRELLASLRAGSIDVAVCALPVDGNDLVSAPILRDEFLLAISTTSELARSTTPVPVSVLRRLDVLLLDDGHCLRDQALDVCAAVTAHPTDLRATSLATLVQMVAAGVGATLLPVSAASVEARPGNGITVRRFTKAPSRTLAMVWRASSPRDSLYRAIASDFTRRLTRFDVANPTWSSSPRAARRSAR